MSTPRDHLRAWALHLAARGWHVFPIRPGSKKPALHGEKTCPRTGICADGHHGWEQRATPDLDRIRACWADVPYNVGIAAGPSRLVIIDLDTAKPGEKVPDRWRTLGIDCGAGVLGTLARRHDAGLRATYTVTTPSGGWHLYYTTPAGAELRNTSGRIGWKVDTRAHGGYVVAPGSTVLSGGYELVDDRDPVELPGWLHQALTPKRSAGVSAPTQIPSANGNAYVAAAVQGEAERVRTAQTGHHNAELNRAAFRLGTLVGAGLLDHATARAELRAAAEGLNREALNRADCDCTPDETDRVIDAGLTAGARKPRPIRTGKEAA